MNRQFKIVFVLAAILLGGAVAYGQERLLEKSEFQLIIDGADKVLWTKTFRIRTIYEIFADGSSSPVVSSKRLDERVPPDRYYSKDNENNETIWIGKKRYTRENNGKWKEVADDQTVDSNDDGKVRVCTARVEYENYKVSENIDLDGQSVSLYETTSKTSANCTGEKSRTEIETLRYWISKDGMLLKTEDIKQDAGKNMLNRRVTVYEYDPKIKIETPIK